MILIELKIIEGRSVTKYSSKGHDLRTVFTNLCSKLDVKGLVKNVW